ncbi:MAG: pseudouridine synthase [Marinagarivorans sp.]|nr:pseudouridine synthase [Marinagarivorans sp.]
MSVNEKLQKVLAAAGFDSRRAIERAIASGEVTLNGECATLGVRVNAGDKVVYRGRFYTVPAAAEKETRVLIYNKPEGEICSRSDPDGRTTVYDHLPALPTGRWISVGRLDINTSGLLLFTNDGELANKLMHPSSSVDREYLVRVHGTVTEEICALLMEGVMLDDGMAKFSDIRESKNNEHAQGTNRWYYCTVMEGRNREVRRLWESQELKVSRLKRVRYGNIFIPSYLRTGQLLELNDKELSDLYQTAGLGAPKRRKFQPKIAETRARTERKLKATGGRNKKKRF